MQRMTTVVMLVVLAGLIYGCQPSNDSGGESGKETAAPSSDSSANAAPAVNGRIREKDPVQAVTRFLTALKNGDHATATSMLSVKAQKETAARGMGLVPPGNPTAEFYVDPESVLQPGDGTTLVLSNWSDVDDNGVKQTYDVGWMLKEEQGGLAITGMATRVFEDSESIILNFEDPDEMTRQRELATEEINRRKEQLRQQENIAREQDVQPTLNR